MTQSRPAVTAVSVDDGRTAPLVARAERRLPCTAGETYVASGMSS